MNWKKIVLGIFIPLLAIGSTILYWFFDYQKRQENTLNSNPQRQEIIAMIQRADTGIQERTEKIKQLWKSPEDQETRKSIESELTEVYKIKNNFVSGLQNLPQEKTPLFDKKTRNIFLILTGIILIYTLWIWLYINKKEKINTKNLT